jgi:O-antigen ligase
MNNNNKLIFFYTILFIIFLYPFSISLSNDDGASANYLFLIFPLCVGLYNKKFLKPKLFWLITIITFFFIFIIATCYQFYYLDFFTRRFISFILFMSIFSFIFIEIDINMLTAFKYALISISFIFSVITLYKFITLGASDLGFEAKGAVGSQRYGFVYVISLWILFFEKKIYNVFKLGLILTIILGLILTFSRSGIVAMIVSLLLASSLSILHWFKSPNFKGIFIGLLFILLLIIIIIFINLEYPIIFDFFYQRLFSYFEKDSSSQIDLDQDSSEGYRVFMLKKVIDFVLVNPITGAGFLGVWILFEDQSGSAHGQFVDVIFRTGLLGLILYLIILYRVALYFFKNYRGYFWGIIGIIVYGFFHETFKLSQGSFILAFLIGLTSQREKTFS